MNPPAAPLDTALADDMKLTPALVQELSQVAAAAAAAPSGGKGAIYQDACTRLGLSLATLHRALGQVVVRPERKRRTDAGLYELPRAEAQTISSYILEHYRGTGKRGITVGQALDDLRKNALVRAESINPASGCVTLLSESAVLRALKGYGLHWQALRSQPLAVAQRRVTGEIVAADIVELNPRFDVNGVTAIMAAKFVREVASRATAHRKGMS